MTNDLRVGALARLLSECARIAIVGGPKTGKTTLAQVSDERPVIHTDRFQHLPWEEVPAAILERCAPLSQFVIEGVQVARALRAGLIVDAVLYLDDPCAEQSKGQRAMSKAVSTVFAEWRAANRTVHVVSPDLS